MVMEAKEQAYETMMSKYKKQQQNSNSVCVHVGEK